MLGFLRRIAARIRLRRRYRHRWGAAEAAARAKADNATSRHESQPAAKGRRGSSPAKPPRPR
ncbi:hypothetical protein [Falsiroseomonas sp. CW058]|uniref:hypothetical protein n=1 Tax=Falsiroseomonas sp. CW058 TaxID=3388664 RepID=UPI003D31CB23